MNFILNDSTPTPAPTSGCCAAQTDAASPGQVSMQVSGSAGTGSTSVSVINRNEFTYLYFIGTAGDLAGKAINAGTWTVELYLTSLTGTCIVDSVFICKADHLGGNLGTIASSTGILTALTANLNSFSVTQSTASSTFGSTDVVIISFQIHGNASGTFTLSHGQNGEITTSPAALTAGGVPPPSVVRGDFLEPGSVATARPPVPAPIVNKPPSPYVVRSDFLQPGLIYSYPPPVPPPVSGKPPPSYVTRSDNIQEAVLWVGKPPVPVPVGKQPPAPYVARSDFSQKAIVWVSQPPIPARVGSQPPVPCVVRSDTSLEAVTWLGKPLPVAIKPPAPAVVRSDSLQEAIVSISKSPVPAPVGSQPPAPYVLRFDSSQDAITSLSKPPVPAPVSGKPPPSYVVRSDFIQEAVTWTGKPATVINPIPVAGLGIRIIAVSFPDGFPTGSLDKPFAGATWQPTTLPVAPYGTHGVRILFNRGPADHIPIHQMGEPSWTTDTFQMFVGDSFTNHFIGGEPVTPPSHSNSPGYPRQWAWDGTYYYRCVSPNFWVRIALSAF